MNAEKNSPKNKTLKMHLLEIISLLVKLKRTRLPIANKAYMLNLFYENVFCSEFDQEEVKRLYLLACKKKGFDEENCVFNFFTAVYLNALFCDYLCKDYGTVRITHDDCVLIQDLLGKLTDDDRYAILFGSAKHFTFGSLAYNNKAYEKVFPLILTALKRKSIEKLLVVDK